MQLIMTIHVADEQFMLELGDTLAQNSPLGWKLLLKGSQLQVFCTTAWTRASPFNARHETPIHPPMPPMPPPPLPPLPKN